MSERAPQLFALAASRELGQAVAREAGLGLLAPEERTFEDGEHKVRALESVRGRDVYVLHSLHGEPGASADEKLVRLLFFLGALRDAGAAHLTALVPYLAYARKDQRSKPRDPVATRYVASFFEAMGTECIVSVDVHNLAAFENAYRCRTVNLEAADILVAHVARLVGEGPVSVVSPDAGGIKRADRFRAKLAAALSRPVAAAFAEKHRSEGELRGEALVGDVRGSTAVIVDDLVSAGHTLDRAARSCIAHGAARVIAAATHGAFAGPANEVLAASPIERLVVTDTVAGARISDRALLARLDRVCIAPLLARTVLHLHATR